jgi:hypothetical protein
MIIMRDDSSIQPKGLTWWELVDPTEENSTPHEPEGPSDNKNRGPWVRTEQNSET